VKRKRRIVRRFCWVCEDVQRRDFRGSRMLSSRLMIRYMDLSQKENDTDEDAERRVDQESASHKRSGDCDNEEAGETVSRHGISPVR